jgi:hypothetical protein
MRSLLHVNSMTWGIGRWQHRHGKFNGDEAITEHFVKVGLSSGLPLGLVT